MKPDVSLVFRTMAQDLMLRVIPAISPAFHQGTIAMVATLLSIASEEWDRVASRRIEENAEMRRIFREAVPVVQDAALRARLADLAATTDSDFRISALDRTNAMLRAALIDLHAYVEEQSGAEAR